MNFQPKVNLEGHFDIRYNQVQEASKLFGYQCIYIPAVDLEENGIWREVTARKFANVVKHDFYYTKDNDTFFNGTESFGGFGFMPMYSEIKYIAKKWFDDVSIEPTEGDLIYDVIEDMIFEITKVNDNISEFNGDKIHNRIFNHKLYLELYKPDFNDDLAGDVMFADVTAGPDSSDDLILYTNTVQLFKTVDGSIIRLISEDTNPIITIDASNPFGILS